MTDLAAQEQDKYRRMWAQPSYRNWSPGADAVPAFLDGQLWQPGDTLGDMGCGTGRAGKLLSQKGLAVTLVDFCRGACEVEGLPFVEAVLWDLPPLGKFDWLYCVDVLEHIPTSKVAATLDNLAAVTRKGGYLQISLQRDSCGSLIGETLHLTVQPFEWWAAQVVMRWPVLASQDRNATACFLIGAPYAQ